MSNLVMRVIFSLMFVFIGGRLAFSYRVREETIRRDKKRASSGFGIFYPHAITSHKRAITLGVLLIVAGVCLLIFAIIGWW